VSANNETLSRVLTVALGLCIVCSVVVSTAAVALKPQQEANKARDLKRNILMAGGLYDPERSVEEQFVSIQPRVVDIDTGVFVDDVDPALFDQRKSAKDPAQSRTLSGAEDRAKILRRENRAVVYLVKELKFCVVRIVRSCISSMTRPVHSTELFFPFAATGCGPHSMGLSPWSPTRTRSWG